MSRVVAGADGAADDDHALVDETIHERGVLLPPVLIANTTSLVPRRAV